MPSGWFDLTLLSGTHHPGGESFHDLMTSPEEQDLLLGGDWVTTVSWKVSI